MKFYLAISLVLFFFGCFQKRPLALPSHRISFQGQVPASFAISLAKTPTEREQGLMFKASLPKNEGLLFLFNDDSKHCFWMKNTSIPLDIVFMNHTWHVVDIITNTTPFSTTPLCPKENARYVLELGAGLSLKYGIKHGVEAFYD